MNNKILKYTAIKLLIAAMITVAFSSTAFSQQTEKGYVLIIQQSPPDAGLVTPNVGVHRPQLNETVGIQAIPKPGYKFVYWMGDVSNPTANRTSINLDAPKIVIAVFEREEFELLARSDVSTGRSGGGAVAKPGEPQKGMPPYVAPDYEWPQYIPPIPTIPVSDVPVPGDDIQIPVPGDENDLEIPVPGEDDPIPEPATMAMLAAGTMLIRKRNRKLKQK